MRPPSEDLLTLLFCSITIFGIHEIHRNGAQHVLRCPAEHSRDRWGGPFQAPVRSHLPDHIGGVLGEQSVLDLACGKLLLGKGLRIHIADRHDAAR
jgi:hypothetical protein